MGKQRRKPVELRFPEVSPAAASQRERATLLRELGDALGEEGNDPALGGSPEGSSIRAQLGDEQDAHEQAGAMESPLTSVTWNPMFQPNTHTNKAPPPSARALRAANRAVGGPLAVRHHATSKQRADAILKRIDRLQAQEQEKSERWEQMMGEMKQGRLALGDAVTLKTLELYRPGHLEALADAQTQHNPTPLSIDQ